MATDMMEVDRPTIPSDPWEHEHSLAAGVNKLVDEKSDTTTNEKRSITTLQLELAKRQRDDSYTPDKRLTVFNNGVISSSSSVVAPFKNNGGRADWESQYGWLGASVPTPRDPNHYKLLDGDKAAEYNSIRNRLHTMVKLSLGISDMRNKVPPLRSDKEYTNQDTAADSFLLLMARLSLNDIPPEQRKEEAKRLLGAVSNMVDDCDIDDFFREGGDSGGGDLVVPSSTLSTGNINSTSDVGAFDSTSASAAVPSSCTTSDAVISSKDDLVLSVAPCPEGNNSLTDDELVLTSNSELATEEISSTMDEGTSTASSVVEEEKRVSTQEDVEFESGGDWQPDDLVETGSDITTSVPTHLTDKTLATKWRKNLIKEIHDIDKVKENIGNFSKLNAKDRLSNYSPIDQIKVQQLTLLTSHHHKLGLSNQELNEKISKVLAGHVYYEGEFEEEMQIIRLSATDKKAQKKSEKQARISALFADAENEVAKKHHALVAKIKSNREKTEVEKKIAEERKRASQIAEARKRLSQIAEGRKRASAVEEEKKRKLEEEDGVERDAATREVFKQATVSAIMNEPGIDVTYDSVLVNIMKLNGYNAAECRNPDIKRDIRQHPFVIGTLLNQQALIVQTYKNALVVDKKCGKCGVEKKRWSYLKAEWDKLEDNERSCQVCTSGSGSRSSSKKKKADVASDDTEREQRVDTSSLRLEEEVKAQQAVQLAKDALACPRLCKRLLLSMALTRTNPRTPPSCYPSHGTVLADRFHWAAYPPLDSILRKNMKRYYELSTDKCQSRDQQEFNNRLVHLIRKEAAKHGWKFDEKVFDDKKIRDRIRNFYKTHMQNAKKRLETMLKNPEKKANIKALAAHYHLIEEKGQDEDGEYPEEDNDHRNDGIRLSLSKSVSSTGRKRSASNKYTEEA